MFNVGDEVVCVSNDSNTLIEVGKSYTIVSFGESGNNEQAFIRVRYDDTKPAGGFRSERFKHSKNHIIHNILKDL